MKAALAIFAAILLPLSAHAVPIRYEFSATIDTISYNTLDPVPADIQATFAALLGAPVTGTFRYESDVGPPIIESQGIGSVYNGAVLDFAANIAGFDIASAIGSMGVQSVGSDRLVVSSLFLPPPGQPIPPPPVLGQILGYEVRGSNLAWVEGVPPNNNPVPSFLADNNPPLALPSYHSQFFVSLWVPGIVPFNPLAPTNASLSTLNASVRPVAVPEPASLALLALGMAAAAAMRRRAVR